MTSVVCVVIVVIIKRYHHIIVIIMITIIIVIILMICVQLMPGLQSFCVSTALGLAAIYLLQVVIVNNRHHDCHHNSN